MTGHAEVRALRRARPRSWFLRGTAAALTVLVAYAWIGGSIDFGELFSGRRAENLRRFLTRDATPPGVRSGDVSWTAWLGDRATDARNTAALRGTIALAVLAAVLSAALGSVIALWTSRTALSARRPFGESESHAVGGPWRPWLGAAARTACVFMRAVPEYILAFLMGAVFPDPAWACVVALVIHNGGILGRLYGETLENLDQRPAAAWHALGAGRTAATLGSQFPDALPRGLTYLFIRFETCLRESTVLGAIGFVSLGYWIVQERAAGHYDEMLVLMLLGSITVVFMDVVSWALRRAVRHAS